MLNQTTAAYFAKFSSEIKVASFVTSTVNPFANPNFATNGFVYVYYAPSGDKAVNRLSRYTFKNDQWDMSSEKIILEVNSQRNICCHTGGSIAFDKNGLLYLSTGDNATPFNQPKGGLVLRGFAPLDDRPGFEQ